MIGNYIAKAPWVDDYDLSSVQYVRCAGAKLDMSIIKGVYERLGIKVIDVYGQTECLGTMRGSWEATLKGIYIKVSYITGYLNYIIISPQVARVDLLPDARSR